MLGAAVTSRIVDRDTVEAGSWLSTWSRRAAALGASFVLFPELALGDYFRCPVALDGPEVSDLRSLAEELEITIGVGLGESDGSARYSSYALLSPQGHLTVHRKTRWQTDACPITLGTRLDTHDLCGLPVGIVICSETREPSVSQKLVERGARLLLIPMALGRSFFSDGRVEGPSLDGFVRQYLLRVSKANGLPLVVVGASGTRGAFEAPQPREDVMQGGLVLINSGGRVLSFKETAIEELFTFDAHWDAEGGSICLAANPTHLV